jgi:hypothetical protein
MKEENFFGDIKAGFDAVEGIQQVTGKRSLFPVPEN